MTDTAASQVSRLPDGRLVSIDHVRESDASRILRYLDTVSGETDFLTFGSGEFSVTEEEEAQDIRRMYATGTGLSLRAVVGSEIVSVAGIQRRLRPRIRHVGVFGISVLRSFWGTGVARLVCERVLSEAAMIGVRRVELRVREDNHRARRLYTKLGFAEEGRLRQAFAVADQSFDDIIMALLLDERAAGV
jgi:RimJ/RimL family protein N-acetyltransferase